jgi:hypothetical protein
MREISAEMAWQLFQETGQIGYYNLYKKLSEQ